MDLDQVKKNWNKIEEFSDSSSTIRKEEVLRENNSKLPKFISRILRIEIVFSLIYLSIFFFFITFNKFFETPFLSVIFYLGVVLTLVLPIMNISSARQFYKSGELNKSYSETLVFFKEQCSRFVKFRYISLVLNLLLLLICIILIPRAYLENPSKNEIITTFIITGIGALLLSRIIWKYYDKQIKHSENLINSAS